jgi:FlaA1/EpsC-like NDP-sugar epimerase
MTSSPFSKASNWFLSRPRKIKRIISVIADCFIVMISLWIAFSLRFSEFYIPPENQLWIFFLGPVIAIPIFIRLGLYRAIVRYIGLHALGTIFKAVTLYTLIFSVIVLISSELSGLVPRTVYGINGLLLLLIIGGSRLLVRWWVTNHLASFKQKDILQVYVPPVIIYGAGKAGIQLAAALNAGQKMKAVAFIDDDKSLNNQTINGVTTYSFDKLPRLIEKYQVRDVLLAMPSISRNKRNAILEKLEPYPFHVKTLPDLVDLAEGKISVSDIKEVDIADILGREAVEPINHLLSSNIQNKSVLVTGAGGSIGSELCRQIVKLKPKLIVLYELNEFSLYSIEQELLQLEPTLPIYALLGSVQNQSRLERLCTMYSVETIYHAAAYKHVPLVENNSIEGVRNNVFGTLNCAQAAINCHVETFVLISTDKAVRPTNTMGATKRFAELILQALANHAKTRFTMVRFGNVLDSSGSVVPLFRQQIANGGPVTVTDARIIRYFMTIPEAAELVIQAGALGKGGDVFVLDMGDPVSILELAKRMIHLSGFQERDGVNLDGDIEISFTGLRPGEKLYEELLIGENVSSTEHKKIMRAEEMVIPWPKLEAILSDLAFACDNNDFEQVRAILKQHVDGFKPQCVITDLLADKVYETHTENV